MLDLASGEGFGAAMLAESAASVIGVDIDERSVEHSRLNYEAVNLGFQVADARELSMFEDDCFDAVVAFEMIEHVEDQGRALDEIRRVLSPEGLLIVSTPDREAYRAAAPENPFHVGELSRAELVELLSSRFESVVTLAQRTITGSALVAPDDRRDAPEFDHPSGVRSFFLERAGDERRLTPELPAMYIIAVASARALTHLPRESFLGDPSLELVREAESSELEARRREIAILRARAAHDASTISLLNSRLRRVDESVTWQLIQRVRARTFKLLGGEESRGVHALQARLRSAGRLLGRGGLSALRAADKPALTRARPRSGGINFVEGRDPDVSIVMPLYAHAELTRAALFSILDHTDGASYELILVDDSEDVATKALLRTVSGATVLVNESNVGYIRSIERGAGVARGRWLVLCNNDIEVQPGWLTALLECGESRPDVAIVAPRYLYPDGSLAEAGAIVWRDGTGANFGRGDDAMGCHYGYRREIDYGSAAVLMVKAEFWREVGGFDERFLPMYYEDTDLCFEARSRGLRVMYEPRARVIHLEGASAGVDESAGHKRHQAENRPKFLEKWRSVLEAEHLETSPQNLWPAANRRAPRVLVVDHRVPTWDRDSGSVRMRGILEALIGLGCHVTLLPDNSVPTQPYTSELQRLGVEVLYDVPPETELARIGTHLSLVILSRALVAGRWHELVRTCAPAARIVFDTVDLHWLREARRVAPDRAGGRNGASLPPEATVMRELERALIWAADATLVVTENERGQVLADVPEANVHVVPNVNQVRQDVPPAPGRRGILFVGGFEHTPNIDGARMLVSEVMPLVWREIPDVPVKIVGADPPESVRSLASPRVEIAGWVPDLDPALDSARVMLAPLTYGAGLKGKVTQALACGLPVVTTPIGAEGLDAVDGEHLMIAETAEELAARTLTVLRENELWSRLSRSGQSLAAERYSSEGMSAVLRALLDDVLGGAGAHQPVGLR